MIHYFLLNGEFTGLEDITRNCATMGLAKLSCTSLKLSLVRNTSTAQRARQGRRMLAIRTEARWFVWWTVSGYSQILIIMVFPTFSLSALESGS